jgi:hypothetical protein
MIPEKWEPVFGKDHAQNIELGPWAQRFMRTAWPGPIKRLAKPMVWLQKQG